MPDSPFGDLDAKFGGHAVVFDLRDRLGEFLEVVSDGQRSRMRNKRSKGGLRHVSSLPLAAKLFARQPVEAMPRTELRSLLYRLDLAVYADWQSGGREGRPESSVSQQALCIPLNARHRMRIQKRWESGIFVILPDDGGEEDGVAGRQSMLAFERSQVWPWVMSDD